MSRLFINTSNIDANASTATSTFKYNNQSSFKQATNTGLFKGSFILSVALLAFSLTSCENASQSVTNTYTTKSNTVDSVMQEQIAKASENNDGKSADINDSTTYETQITDVYGKAEDRAEYDTDPTDIDITLTADENYSVLGNTDSNYSSNDIDVYTSATDQSTVINEDSEAPDSNSSVDSSANSYLDSYANSLSGFNEPSSEPDTSVTYDLSVMGADMVYAAVYDLMTNYESHVDDTYKIKGTFYSSVDPETRNRYYFCVISDALGCCSQGLEFMLEDNAKYPDDYPEEGSDVVLTGTWSQYIDDKNGDEFYALLNSKILK